MVFDIALRSWGGGEMLVLCDVGRPLKCEVVQAVRVTLLTMRGNTEKFEEV